LGNDLSDIDLRAVLTDHVFSRLFRLGLLMFQPLLIIKHGLIKVGFLLIPTTDVPSLIVTLDDFKAHPLDVTAMYLFF
jgi:hypothetical protein